MYCGEKSQETQLCISASLFPGCLHIRRWPNLLAYFSSTSPDEQATTKQACRDAELTLFSQQYKLLRSIFIFRALF